MNVRCKKKNRTLASAVPGSNLGATLPKNKATTTFDWSYGDFRTALTWYYTSGYDQKASAAATAVQDRVDAYNQFDLDPCIQTPPAAAADTVASLAFINTILATAAAVLGWTLVEAVSKGKPSALGAASGGCCTRGCTAPSA